MKRSLIICSMLLFFKSFALWPVMDVGATTQLINSVANETVMINNQYQMLKGIAQGDIHVSDFSDTLNTLSDISNRGLAVSYATKDLDSKFGKVFGEEGSSADQQENQNQSMLDSALNTFKSASEQLSYTQAQANAVKSITNASNNANGVVAVAQGTNQLINSTNSQLQSMNTMQAQANSLLATNTAEKAATAKAINKQRKEAFAFTNTYKPYQDNSEFSNIPNFNIGV